MAKLKLNASRRNPENLAALADIVHPKVVPVAPAVPPVPDVEDEAAELLAACTECKAANAAWAAGKVTLAALAQTRREKGDILRAKHTKLGAILEVKSNGDPVALSATGYDLADENTPTTTPPAQILNLKITAGDNDASVDMTCDPDDKAGSYEWQITEGDPVTGPYVTKDTTTASSVKILNLTSGTRIWGRVRGIGASGKGPWSDPATKIVP